MIDRVKRTIEEHRMFCECKNIVVGLSGGADSVSLIFALKNIISESSLGINLVAAHMNHMLRAESADSDETYVAWLCEKLNIPVRVKRCDIRAVAKQRGVSLEMAGRDERYAFLEETAVEFEQCKIAVAHNLNDRAESIFLNLIRGTGLSGLKGIPYKRGNIIRPLLDVDKDEIREFCTANSLEFCVDESNFEIDFLRNKIRIELFPTINEMLDMDIGERLIRLSNNVSADEKFLEKETERASVICYNSDDMSIDCREFGKLDEAIGARILKRILNKNFEAYHVNKLFELINNSATGKKLELSGNVLAVKEYERVFFKEKDKKCDKLTFEYPLSQMVEIIELSCGVSCEVVDYDFYRENLEKYQNSSFKQAFDYDSIKECILRTRRSGDVFCPYRGSGTKKLKDFFIDNKFPVQKRDRQLLLASGNDIVWVMGFRVGSGFGVYKETQRVAYVKLLF